MSKEDLIPKDLSQRPDHKELSRKGGKSKSTSKSKAAKLREIKKGNVKDLDSHIRSIITDPDYAADDLAKYIEALKKAPMDQRTKVQYGKLLLERYKTLHGDKTEIKGEIEIKGSIFEKFKQLK